MNYFPSITSAQAHCRQLFNTTAEPYTVKELPNSCTVTAIYRHEETHRLIGTIDQVVVCPDNIRQAGQDLASFKFDSDGLSIAYYFTDFLRKA